MYNWLKQAFAKTNNRSIRTSRRRRPRLMLEVLEDRLTPAFFMVTAVSDDAGLTAAGGVGTEANPYLIGSLRSAIEQTNSAAGADTITFAPALAGATITLGGSSLPDVSEDLTINGPAARITLDGDESSRIFRFLAATTNSLSNLNITRGYDGETGGGIYNDGALSLTNCTLSNNKAYYSGGGIYSNGSLALTDCTIANNSTVLYYGGGILSNDLSLTLMRCTFTGNYAGDEGGALKTYNDDGISTITNCLFTGNAAGSSGGGIAASYGLSATLTDCTFVNNTAVLGGAVITSVDFRATGCTFIGNSAESGGGIYNYVGDITLTNCTFTNNSAEYGGAINHSGYVSHYMGDMFFPELSVVNCTIVLNQASYGGGIYAGNESEPFIYNTIIAGNTSDGATPNDIELDPTYGGIESASSHNLIGDAATAGGLIDKTSDPTHGNIVGIDGSGVRSIATIIDTVLRKNGGPTRTHALLPTSPAIDAGNDALADDFAGDPLDTDQRGFGRLYNTVDIGAYEFQPAHIVGRQWSDLNRNGKRDAGEPYLNGWTVELRDATGAIVGTQETHDIDIDDNNTIDPETETGWYLFVNKNPGPYVVHSVLQEGWEQTAPGPITELTLGSTFGHWDYDDADGDDEPGPGEWSEIAPDASGFFQTPVNLTGPTVDLSEVVEWHYEPTVVAKVFNNGHTVEALYNASAANHVNIGDEEFELEQFHFHSESEHAIDGVLSDAELHLVHQHEHGGLTVLGILLQVQADAPDNPAFAAVFNELVNLEESGSEVFPTTPIDAGALLPGNTSGYFYQGSLTTPPGTEGVNFFVFSTPVIISQAQLDAYRAVANHDPDHDFFPGNRPLQALNGRQLNQFNHEITLNADATNVDFGAYQIPVAPTVIISDGSGLDSGIADGAGTQHSSIREIVVNLTEPIAGLDNGDTFKVRSNNIAVNGHVLSLDRLEGGKTFWVWVRYEESVDSSQLVLNFSADGKSSLEDGNYVLHFGAGFSGLDDVKFHRLFGDVDGDHDVDSLDKVAFEAAYGSVQGQSNYRSYLDSDHKGVWTRDRKALNKNFLRFVDQDGDKYRITIKGSSAFGVAVKLDDADGDGKGGIEEIVAIQTDADKDSIAIKVKKAKGGDGIVQVSAISGGGLKSIDAPEVDLVGGYLSLDGALGSLRLHKAQDSLILATTVHEVAMAAFLNSNLYAGYDPDDESEPFAGGAFTPGGRIDSFTVDDIGAAAGFAGSTIAAEQIGKVRLRSVDGENGDHFFGVLAKESLGSVQVKDPRFTYDPDETNVQGFDEFRVIIDDLGG